MLAIRALSKDIFSLVGYGTQTPESITGKAIGGFCAIVGVFILTFSVRIVVEGFARHYRNRQVNLLVQHFDTPLKGHNQG